MPATPPPAFAAAIQCKCPQCRKGPLFLHGPYHPKFLAMPANCPVCGVAYEPEPGFYWGAMYVNYGFIVALFLATVLGFQVLGYGDAPIWQKMALYLGLVVILLPLLTRYSRVGMLYLFGGIKFRREVWNG